MARQGGGRLAGLLLPARSRLGARGSLALVLALAVPFVWIFSMSMTLAAPSGFPYGEQVVFSLALGASLLGLGSAARRGGGAHGKGPLAADAACGAVLAVAAFALPLGWPAWAFARAALLALAGAAYAWLVLRCFGLTCLVGREGAFSAVLVPFALAALARLGLSALSGPLPLATLAVLAASGPLALWGARALGRRLGPAGRAAPSEGAGRAGVAAAPAAGAAASAGPAPAAVPAAVPLGAFLAETALCALVLGFFKGGVGLAWGGAESAVNYLARAGVALVLLLVFTGRGGRGPTRGVRAAISAALLALLAASLLGGEAVSAGVSRAMFSLSRNFALVVVYLMALDLAHRGGWPAGAALGLPRGLFELAQGVGVAVSAAVGAESVPALFTPQVTFVVTAFVVLVVSDLLYQLLASGVPPSGASHAGARPAGQAGEAEAGAPGAGGPPGFSPAPGESPAGSAVPLVVGTGSGAVAYAIPPQELDERCAYLGWLCKLTAREAEVARLSCGGLSKADMAAELGLSVNTVRWHAQNAYAKLGVHNVSELLALLARTHVPGDFKDAEAYLGTGGR